MKTNKIKKYFIKYTLEFVVIVLGISVSFWLFTRVKQNGLKS